MRKGTRGSRAKRVVLTGDEGTNMTINKGLKIISVIQIVGGIVGVYATSPLYRDIYGNLIIVWRESLLLIPFVFSLISGILLWQSLRVGIVLSMLVQGLQIIQISIKPLFYYIFYSGIKFCIDFDWPKIGFSFEIGSRLDLMIGKHGKLFMFNINILALLFFIQLLKYLKNDTKVVKI